MTRDDLTSPVDSPGAPWYQPLAKRRLSDRVAEAILESISERGLAPGDRMPTEPQLCEQFGVSRTVVREAIRTLEARGVVRGGPRTGLHVAADDAENVSRSVTLFIQRRPGLSYEQVRDVRAMLEIEIAGRAAERATPLDLARLSDAADRIEHATGGDALYEADVAFHRLIADAAHNELYAVLLDSISDVLVESRHLSPPAPHGDRRGSAGHHGRILDAIVTHDVEPARDAMRRHLKAADRAYRRRLAAQPGPPADAGHTGGSRE